MRRISKRQQQQKGRAFRCRLWRQSPALYPNGESVVRRKGGGLRFGRRITLSLSSGRPKPGPVVNPRYVASDVARVERQRNPGAVAGLTTGSRISLSSI